MIILLLLTLLGQDIGSAEPPFKEATVSLSVKLLNNAEKRCDAVQDLADKSGMNYRLLAMKIAEKWQSSIKADKLFLKNIYKCKTVEFTVKKEGAIEIKGIEPPKKEVKRKNEN